MVPGDVPPTRKASFRRAPALARRHRIETKLATEAARFTDRRFGAPPPARRWRCWRHTALPLQACRLSIGAAFASAFASIGHLQNQQVSAARLPETKNQSRIARLPASLQESWPLGGKA
jgi:hypothetical protein